MATLYAAKGGNTVSDLYTLDPVTGVATSIGATGHAITGLAVDPTDPTKVYAVTSALDPSTPHHLLRITIAAGVVGGVTNIGDLGQVVPDICFDSGGQLWGWGDIPDQLIAIDKVTGAVTGFGFTGITTHGDGLDFVSGTLYLFGKGIGGDYYTVNTSTGALTDMGPTTSDDGDVVSVIGAGSTDGASKFWAIFNDSGSCKLATINVATGNAHVIAPIANKMDALAWDNAGGGGGIGADFIASPLSGHPPLTVAFTDLSTGLPSAWLWDFGDGHTSTDQNPTHTYDTAGSYDVTLTAT